MKTPSLSPSRVQILAHTSPSFPNSMSMTGLLMRNSPAQILLTRWRITTGAATQTGSTRALPNSWHPLSSAIEPDVRSGATSSPCAHARNIVELESLKITQDSIEYGCNYSLGERLFLDLNRTLGDTQFQQGFRELYIASAARDDTDDDGSASIGIGHVREAFRLGEIATNTVITRWYDGTEPYDPFQGSRWPGRSQPAQHQWAYRQCLHHNCRKRTGSV